jgi:hypothetical protein
VCAPDATSVMRTAAAWPPSLSISPPCPPRQAQEISRAAPCLLHVDTARYQPRPPLPHCSVHARAPGVEHATHPCASTHRHPFCPRVHAYKKDIPCHCPPHCRLSSARQPAATKLPCFPLLVAAGDSPPSGSPFSASRSQNTPGAQRSLQGS